MASVGAARAAALAILLLLAGRATGGPVPIELQRPFGTIHPLATLRIGKTADWVVVAPDAVWVGSTGPNAVTRIDPVSNRRIARVRVPGEPCAGLARGFGSLWVPLCARTPALARIDLATNRLVAVLPVGPAAAEGGIAVSDDSLWLVTDKSGTLARIDPATSTVRQRIALPAGAFNPIHHSGVVWVSQVEAAAVIAVDATTGALIGTVDTGPAPRFLAADDAAVWTLNQGDGSLSRIDPVDRTETARVALGTPGHGGDIAVAGGVVWTTMMGAPLTATDAASGRIRRQWLGKGGDSLGVGLDSIWLTDYHQGTIARIALADVDGPDPLVGVWRLDTRRSVYRPGPAPGNLTYTYLERDGEFTARFTRIDADGTSSSGKSTFRYDGTPRPIGGFPEFDAIAFRQLDDGRVETSQWKDGKPVGRTMRTISADRHEMTVVERGTTLAGVPFENTLVLVRL